MMGRQAVFAPSAAESGTAKFLKDTVAGTCGQHPTPLSAGYFVMI